MNPTLTAHAPTVAFVASVNLSASSVEASDFASTRPKAGVEYRRQRQATVATQLPDAESVRA